LNADFLTRRAWIVDAVKANPAAVVTDPALLARLDDPACDCSFDELGFDSLARMELSIWLQIEVGVEIEEGDVLDHPSVNALAAFLAGRGS